MAGSAAAELGIQACVALDCAELDWAGGLAGGSAKQARDRHFQAILPLRGKILNVERKDDADILKNTEIASLIVALGLGMKTDKDQLQGLRYGKVRQLVPVSCLR